jgi:hypothetical protein
MFPHITAREIIHTCFPHITRREIIHTFPHIDWRSLAVIWEILANYLPPLQ